MDLRITHETRYDYSPAVETAQHMAHLRPIDTACQRLLRHRLDIFPSPAQCTETPDVYGNVRTFFSLQAPHTALHWWIVPRINDFRPQVESRLSRALGVPVRIDQLQADGDNGLVPAIAVQGLHVLQADGSPGLTLNQVKVALSVPSLLRLRAEQIVIDAPQLTVQRAADGSVRIAGVLVQTSQDQDSGGAGDWLFRQREVLLQGGSIIWDDQLH